MASVTVTGLPSYVKFNKLIYLLKGYLKKYDINKFWIRELSDDPHSDSKQMTVEFDTNHDAHKARNALNNYKYVFQGTLYPLSARMMEKGRSPSDYGYHDSKVQHQHDRYERYSRERSRSPMFNEASKLDLEIELLRKQRLVIEEERRLLLERKKLELIREYGPSAIKEFEYLIESRETRRPEPERECDHRPHRPSPPRRKPRLAINKHYTDIPYFVLPCKRLINEMKVHLKGVSKNELPIIIKLIRSTLRKRIAVALEGKEYMVTPEITSLYRKLYPCNTDKDLVKKLIKNVREGYLTQPKEDQKTNNEKIEASNEKDEGTNSAAALNQDRNKDYRKGSEDHESNTNQVAIDKNTEIKNECALSLDATEIELSINNLDEDKEWMEGGTDWNEMNH